MALPGSFSYPTDTEADTETETDASPPSASQPDAPSSPSARSGSELHPPPPPPTMAMGAMTEDEGSATPVMASAPQTPKNPTFLSNLTPPTPSNPAAAAATEPTVPKSSPPPPSPRPLEAFEPTETEKASPSLQGREIWIADGEQPTTTIDAEGRPDGDRTGEVQQPPNWKDEALARQARGERVPELQWRTLVGLSKRGSRSSSIVDPTLPSTATSTTVLPNGASVEGSLTGVGSSAAYKPRGSLPPGAAPASTPGPQHTPKLSRSAIVASDGSSPPPTGTRARRKTSSGEVVAEEDATMIAEDDIIGAVTVDRRSGRGPTEYATIDPALLGRAVSHVTSPNNNSGAGGSRTRSFRHEAQRSAPPVAGPSIPSPPKRTGSGAVLSGGELEGVPMVGADEVVTGSLRTSRSADLLRTSLPPMASWSRYPSPVGSPYEVTSKDPSRTTTRRTSSRPPPNQQQLVAIDPTPSPGIGAGVGGVGPEVCVECMMRDRDMADVDVTSPGVWARRSDLDFQEVLALEDAEDMAVLAQQQLGRRGSVATSGQCSSVSGEDRAPTTTTTTVESGSPAARGLKVGSIGGGGRRTSSRESSGPPERTKGVLMGSIGLKKKRRIGRGQALTSAALKLWTSMTPPASSHRWKTLQTYLQEQAHLLELEQRARAAAAAVSADDRSDFRRGSVDARSQLSLRTSQSDASRVASAAATGTGPSPSPAMASGSDLSFLNSAPPTSSPTAMNFARARGSRHSTSVLSNGMLVDTSAAGPDERDGRGTSRAKSRNRQSRVSVPSPASGKSASPAASLRSYSYGDQPWLAETTRTGSPLNASTGGGARPAALGAGRMGAASMTDLQQPPGGRATPRSVSPSRYSVQSRRSAFFDAGGRSPFSGLWGRGGRRSASHSVFSFAPSGSMIDMHVGLSQDRHNGFYDGPVGLNDSVASFNVDPRAGSGIGLAPSSQQQQMGPRGAVQRRASSNSDQQLASAGKTKKKRKGIKGFLNKLGIGSSSGRASSSTTTVTSPNTILASSQQQQGGEDDFDDEEPLEPPPPLSVLARERNARSGAPATTTSRSHGRNGSSSSLPLVQPPQQQGGQVIAPGGPDAPLPSPVSTKFGPSATVGYGVGGGSEMFAEELADFDPSSSAPLAHYHQQHQQQRYKMARGASPAEASFRPVSPPLRSSTENRRWTATAEPTVWPELKKERSLTRLPDHLRGGNKQRMTSGGSGDADDGWDGRKPRVPWVSGASRSTSSPGPMSFDDVDDIDDDDDEAAYAGYDDDARRTTGGGARRGFSSDQRSVASKAPTSAKPRSRVLSAVLPAKLRAGGSSSSLARLSSPPASGPPFAPSGFAPDQPGRKADFGGFRPTVPAGR